MSEFSEIKLCVNLIILISLIDIISYNFMTNLKNVFWNSHCWIVLIWSFLTVIKMQTESFIKTFKLLMSIVLLHSIFKLMWWKFWSDFLIAAELACWTSWIFWTDKSDYTFLVQKMLCSSKFNSYINYVCFQEFCSSL